MATSIGSLAVTLALDGVAFASGLDKSDKGLKRFAASALATLSTIEVGAGAIGGGVTGAFDWVKQGIDDLAQLGRESRQFGVSVEELSGLQFAAGHSAGELEGALRHLNVKLNEASAGSKEARDAFARFGLDGQELAKLGTAGALDKIADRMREVGVAGGGARAAMDLMGREAQGIIPFLEKGSAAIHDAEAAGKGLGAIVSQEEVDRATKAQEAMDQLWAAAKGVQRTVASELAPVVTAAAQGLLDYLSHIDIKGTIKGGIDYLENSIPDVVKGFGEVVKEVVRVGSEIDRNIQKLSFFANLAQHPTLAASVGPAGVQTGLSAIDAVMDKRRDAALAAVDADAKAAANLVKTALDAAKAPLDHPAAAAQAAKSPLTDEEIKRLVENPEAGLNIFDSFTNKVARLTAAFGDATKADERFAGAMKDLNEQLEKSVATRAAEIEKAAAGPLDKLKADFAELKELQDEGQLSAVAYARALAKDFNDLGGPGKILHPGADEQGSVKAYETILHDQDRNRMPDMQERVAKAVEAMEKRQQKQLETDQRIADALEKVLGKKQ